MTSPCSHHDSDYHDVEAKPDLTAPLDKAEQPDLWPSSAGALGRLAAVATAHQHDVNGTIEATTTLLAESLDAGAVIVARIEGLWQRIEHTVDRANMGAHVGTTLPLWQEILGGAALKDEAWKRIVVVADARHDGLFGPTPTGLAARVRSCACVVLHDAAHQPQALLSILYPHVKILNDHDREMLVMAGLLIEGALENERLRAGVGRLLDAADHQARDLGAVAACFPGGVVVVDRAGLPTLVNALGARFGLLGAGIGQAQGRRQPVSVRDARTGALLPSSQWPLSRALAGETVEGVDLLTRMTEPVEERVLHTAAAPVRGARGVVEGAVNIVLDVTDARALAREVKALRHDALHDQLTGLPNRTLLLDRMEQALLRTTPTTNRYAPSTQVSVALLLLDLDHFKEVNDALGHPHGDLVLQQVAAKLRAAVPAAQTVARLGGDEFAVLLPDGDAIAAMGAAHALLAALDVPWDVEGQSLHLSIGIGIALAPLHDDPRNDADVHVMLRRAEVAMYSAKRARSGYAFYDATRDDSSADRLTLIAELRQAIETGQLVLHYQPTVDIATSQTHSVEALVRWRHPRHGLLQPDSFINLAEHTGLVVGLTHWVLEAAMHDCHEWRTRWPDLGVAVNLSIWNLHDPHLPEAIGALLAQYDLPANALRVELTETTVMSDIQHSIDVLSRLSALGVRIAVDDFGAGHSSLTYLKRLPVDELKIDRSFVLDMDVSRTDDAIVRSVVDLGHDLGLRVTAEGVMNTGAWDRLTELGCDMAQGYALCPPLSPPDLDHWLDARR